MAGVATTLGIAIVPPSSGVTATGDETADGTDIDVPWEGPITTETATPIARYHYKPAGEEFVPTAPINVVALETDRSELIDVLVDAGWTTQLGEYARFAIDRTTGEYVRQESTAAETYYGTNGRLHVRCWEFEDVLSIQVHEDTGARPTHGIASYERARAAIEELYDAAGWAVASAAVDLTNEQGDHDGSATVLVPGDAT